MDSSVASAGPGTSVVKTVGCHLTTGSTARAAGSFGEVSEGSMFEIKWLRSTFPYSPPRRSTGALGGTSNGATPPS